MPQHGTAQPAAEPGNSLRSHGRTSYHSHVCSTTGDAIERIAAAIDQLANGMRAMSEPELSARVAALWLMMGEVDPELTRRQRRYTATDTGPADGAPCGTVPG